MKELIDLFKAVGPTQYVACLVVLPLTTFGALLLVWLFMRYNRKQCERYHQEDYYETQSGFEYTIECDRCGRKWKDD